MDNHRALCTLEKKAANVSRCFSVQEGNVLIYMLYCVHKMKSELGAQEGKKPSIPVLRVTEKASLAALKKGRVM